MTKEEYINPKRDTGNSLFLAMLARAREHGDMADIDPILDYTLPNEHESMHSGDTPLTHYEFNIVTQIDYGGSEGIYVTCYLEGVFDDSGELTKSIGTIKTLEVDLNTCKLMGKLCGILLHHGTRYVNENLHRYTPRKELAAEYERKHFSQEGESNQNKEKR